MAIIIGIDGDNSGFKAKLEESKRMITDAASTMSQAGVKLDEMFQVSSSTSSDLEKLKDTVQSLSDQAAKGGKMTADAYREAMSLVDGAFSQIDSIVDQNKESVSQLEGMLGKVKAAAVEAFNNNNAEDYARLNGYSQELEKQIGLHKQNAAEAGSLADELLKVSQNMQPVAQGAVTMRTQIRMAREEAFSALGQYGQNSQQFQQAAEKLGMLQRQMRLVSATAQSYMPRAWIAGTVQGLSAVSGAFGVAQGSMALFGDKSQDLQKIMVKLQGVMAVTQGLQSISNALLKSSSFQISVVAALKRWWTGLLIKASAAQEAENVAVGESVAAQTANTAATGAAAVATEAGTAANAGFALSFKAIGLAIKNIPVIGWILAAVTALIAMYQVWKTKQKEIEQQQAQAHERAMKYQKEIASTVGQNTGSQIAKLKILSLQWKKLGSDIEAQKKFIRNNQEAFKALGISVNNVEQAQNALINNTPKLVQSLINAAKAAAYASKIQSEFERQLRGDAMFQQDLNDKQKQINDKEKDIAWRHSKGMDIGYDNVELQGLKKELKDLVTRKANYDRIQGHVIEQFAKNSASYTAGSQRDLSNAGIAPYYSDSNKKNGSSKNGTKDYTEDLISAAKDRARAAVDAEFTVTQEKIDSMEEGSEKTRRQIDLDYAKEMETVRRNEEDRLEQLRKYARTEAEAKRKKYNGASVSIPQDEQAAFDAQRDAAVRKREQSIAEDDKARKEKAQKEKSALEDYLIEYGTYQEKKKAITEKYNYLIANAETEGEKKTLGEKMKGLLQDLDIENLKKDINWEKVFGNLEAVSTNTLDTLIKQLKEFIAVNKKLSPENIKILTEAIDKMDVQKEKNTASFSKFGNAIKDYIKALKEKKNAESNDDKKNASDNVESKKKTLMNVADGAAQNLGSITNTAKAVKGLADDLGINLPEGISKALDGMDELTGGLKAIASGDLVGGAIQVIGGLVSTFKGLGDTVASIFGMGADYSKYNKMLDSYNKLRDVWETILNDKKEYLSLSYGAESVRAAKEAQAVQDKANKALRELGAQWLNSGAGAGSHSIGVRIANDARKNGGWSQLQAWTKAEGIAIDRLGGRLDGLFSLTAEQLKSLRDSSPLFWAALDAQTRDYLNGVIDGEKQISDLQDQIQEKINGISYDSFRESFLSTLSDMSKGTDDMVDNFEEKLKNSILETLIADKYNDKIRELYDSWYKAYSDDGNISPEEALELNKQNKDIAASLIAERNAMAKAFGWDTAASQKATSGGYQTLSEDTGKALEGRFTSLQMIGERIGQNTEEMKAVMNSSYQEGRMSSNQLINLALQRNEMIDVIRKYSIMIKENTDYLKDIKNNTGKL